MIYTLVRGDTFNSGIITLKSNGVVTDITGMTMKMSIKHRLNSSTYIHGPINATIIDAVGGKFSFTIDKTITATFPVGEIYYDIEITDSNGIRTTPMVNKILVNSDITVT